MINTQKQPHPKVRLNISIMFLRYFLYKSFYEKYKENLKTEESVIEQFTKL